jgi:aldehyde dehydrogenase (NAD+)
MSDSSFIPMRHYFESGATRTYSFRAEQLSRLKRAILRNENEINAALYQDLKKSKEEAYATETGLVIAEINYILKNLRAWILPKPTGTDLVNFPSGSKIYRDPYGVVLIIAPWNYPLQLLLIPLVGAIAGGNCAVLKPSELAPATAAIIEKMISETFPPEFVKVIQGDGATVVPSMMNSFRFDYLMYTGSVPVGKSIYQLAARDLIPVTLELGGKSPAVVEEDADLRAAARRIALGKFINVGQTCVAPDYVLVHASVKDKLVAHLKKEILRFYGQDPAASYDYGKIINEKRFDRLTGYLKEGTILHGGQTDRSRLYIAPTLLEHVSEDAAIMNEEIFGPILPILTFTSFGNALQVVQRNPNPLSFYLFTSDKKKEKNWIGRLSFGGGCINNTVWQFSNPHMPFGGVGNSGIGHLHGKYSFETFTRLKPVLKTPTWFDPSLKYPSYKGRLNFFKWIIR